VAILFSIFCVYSLLKYSRVLNKIGCRDNEQIAENVKSLPIRFGKQTASQKRIPSSSIIPTVDSYHSYVSCKVAS
jgi:hypothetical protein